MFSIELSCDAQKYLEKLDTQISDCIKEKLRNSLSKNPPSSDSKFIARDSYGDSIFRQRIGDYRALYTIKYKTNIVLIAKIDKRPTIYTR